MRPFNVDRNCVLCLLPEFNTKWLDHSTYDNDGTIEGATLKDYGRYGKSLYFDGSDDYVEVADATILDLPDNFSMDAWVNLSETTGTQCVLGKYSNTYNFNIEGGKVQLELVVTGLVDFRAKSDDVVVVTGSWYHVGATRAGKTMALYCNGAALDITYEDTQTDADVLTTSNNLFIGARKASTLPLQGYIDEVRLFTRVLAAWEVKALYEAGKPT